MLGELLRRLIERSVVWLAFQLQLITKRACTARPDVGTGVVWGFEVVIVWSSTVELF